jgi:deazaflavin-dependent oxidoreductase (nitroreductase family)
LNGVLEVAVGRLGVPVPATWILAVPGRRTGRVHTTPVCLLTLDDGRRYLVAPRGVTGWVRNLRAAGRGELRRGRRVGHFTAREVAGEERVEALVEYLGRFGRLTRRFFDVPPGAGPDAVRRVAGRHPVFRIA